MSADATQPANDKTGVLFFSKDRPLQLEAALRSFWRNCRDLASTDVRVLYKSSNADQARGYAQLRQQFPWAIFESDDNFAAQVIDFSGQKQHLLFVVDDTVFIRPFRLDHLIEVLSQNPKAIGYSLRLGENTRHCFPTNKPQRPPVFTYLASGDLRYAWQGTEWDFSYPLEVSSSLFRTRDIQGILETFPFRHPNSLEEALVSGLPSIQDNFPQLLCAERSLAFSIPANRVQNTNQNRISTIEDQGPEHLLGQFLAGKRIDIDPLQGILPTGCHQEIAFQFKGDAPNATETRPGAKKSTAASRLTLAPFFATDIPYVVLKLPENFPHYKEYSDLDILCTDPDKMEAHIRAQGETYIAVGWRIETVNDGAHRHVDFFRPGANRLSLRFDLLEDFLFFKKVAVFPELAPDILSAREPRTLDGVATYVPRVDHDCATRVLEYLEYGEERPDKIKHLNFVDAQNDLGFVDVLNGYTNLDVDYTTPKGQVDLVINEKTPEQMANVAHIRARPPRRERLDYFMLWGHGLAQYEDVLSRLRHHPDFQIMAIFRRDVGDMGRFITRVYEADFVPLEHLKAKTQYLLTVPPEVLVILVRNLNPAERYFGEGPFRHIQCATVKAMKEAIRNAHNPYIGDKRTENHVIHASDYPSGRAPVSRA